jgi:hypothetical protein
LLEIEQSKTEIGVIWDMKNSINHNSSLIKKE